MNEVFKIDGKEFTKENFTEDMTRVYEMLAVTRRLIEEVSNEMAILNKAKNGYMLDLKEYIVKQRTGIDVSTLLDME